MGNITGNFKRAAAAALVFGFATTALAAVDGRQLTTIAPVFHGADGNLSFLRFLNTSQTASSTFTVIVVGMPSGTQLGTATFTAPAHSSPQHAMNAILQQASVTGLPAGDNGYTLYVRNPNNDSGIQHVIFNDGNRFFENMSWCQHFSGARYQTLVGWLTNFHTTRLTGFPMTVNIHNYNNVTQPYRITAYDSTTGSQIGQPIIVDVLANETRAISNSTLEQMLNFSPATGQIHMTLYVDTPNNGIFNAVATSVVFNSALNANINMTTSCKVRP